MDFIITKDSALTNIALLHPLTRDALVWIGDNLPEDRQTLGNAVAIEDRYLSDIVVGIRESGLTVH